MKVAIIGAGLAGCAAAYMLKQAGAEPVIYEAGDSIAPGASGNDIGLYNPRLSVNPGFYTEAFEAALRVFSELTDIDWNQCGALHLTTNETREKRFLQAVQNWGWPDMKYLYRTDAAEIAGVDLNHDALWLPKSGTVSPKKLCAAYAKDIEIRLHKKIESLDEIKADAIILACGMGVKNFEAAKDIDLRAVRGQITEVSGTAASRKLKTNLCYGGYFTPAVDGLHMAGATFQRWLDHSEIIEGDDADNISKLAKVVPELAEGLKVTGCRAAVRATTPDHKPVIGQLADKIYISAGHGSHGIISSIAAAFTLKTLITQ